MVKMGKNINFSNDNFGKNKLIFLLFLPNLVKIRGYLTWSPCVNKTGLIVVDDDGNGLIVFVSDGICIGLYW